VHKGLKSVLSCLLPSSCVVCGKQSDNHQTVYICDSCFSALPRVSDPVCQMCNTPLGGVVQNENTSKQYICTRCSKKHVYYSALISVFYYAGAVVELIHTFKYKHRVSIGRFLTSELAKRLAELNWIDYIDCIVPVPMHPRRLYARGYNQAFILARYLGTAIKKPVFECLKRESFQHAQVGTPYKERIENVKNAFRIQKNSFIRGKRIFLLDDVYTTGATINECSKLLRAKDPSDIVVGAVACANLSGD
jgi:competence protein ComFC